MERTKDPRAIALTLSFLIISSAFLIGAVYSVDTPAGCENPPPSNPNPCHIYKWFDFPYQNQTFTAQTGLFNNDTSYQFTFNVTGIAAFTLCTNILLAGVNYNDSLTLQYLNSSIQWANVATNPTGGDLPIANGVGTWCSNSFGYFPSPTNSILNLCAQITAFTCVFRIAGHCYESSLFLACFNPAFPASKDQYTFSEMSVQFYSGNTKIQGTVLCTAIVRSLTGFTTQCQRTFAPNNALGVIVGWYSTNRTGVGAGCGANANCVRGPATFTCTIPANSVSCSVGTTYSPAFTGSIPIPVIDWSNLNGGTGNFIVLSAPFIYPILT